MTDEELAKIAMEAKKNSYAPYSKFHVGAALLGKNGKVYKGCNVENAAYGSTICAERTAVFTAVCDGCRDFEKIAIATDSPEFASSCGSCRQVMSEFCDDLKIILVNNRGQLKIDSLARILPDMFDLQIGEKFDRKNRQEGMDL